MNPLRHVAVLAPGMVVGFMIGLLAGWWGLLISVPAGFVWGYYAAHRGWLWPPRRYRDSNPAKNGWKP